MIHSEKGLKNGRVRVVSERIIHATIIARKFSPGEPKCLKGVTQGSGWPVPVRKLLQKIAPIGTI